MGLYGKGCRNDQKKDSCTHGGWSPVAGGGRWNDTGSASSAAATHSLSDQAELPWTGWVALPCGWRLGASRKPGNVRMRGKMTME